MMPQRPGRRHREEFDRRNQHSLRLGGFDIPAHPRIEPAQPISTQDAADDAVDLRGLIAEERQKQSLPLDGPHQFQSTPIIGPNALQLPIPLARGRLPGILHRPPIFFGILLALFDSRLFRVIALVGRANLPLLLLENRVAHVTGIFPLLGGRLGHVRLLEILEALLRLVQPHQLLRIRLAGALLNGPPLLVKVAAGARMLVELDLARHGPIFMPPQSI